RRGPRRRGPGAAGLEGGRAHPCRGGHGHPGPGGGGGAGGPRGGSRGGRGREPATTLLWGFLVAVAIWAVAVPWWSWPLAALGDPGVAAAVLGVGLLGTLLPFALAVGAVRVISAATAGIAG